MFVQPTILQTKRMITFLTIWEKQLMFIETLTMILSYLVISMPKIQNHAYHSFCFNMMQKILFVKKHVLKVKTTLAVMTFSLQTLQIVFKIYQQ